MLRYRMIFGTILGALLSLFALEAGAQPIQPEDVSDEIEVSYDGELVDGHIVVGGTITNIGPKRFPCLMVVFGFETNLVRMQNGRTVIRDLGSGEKRHYSKRFPSADGVWHETTETCAPAKTDIAVKHCAVTGELFAPRGFIQRVADHPDDPGTIHRLREVLLFRGDDVIDRAPLLGRGKTVRSFHFKRVPVGETFQVGLGGGWAFHFRDQVRVQCGQPSGTRNIGRKQVRP